MSFWLEKKYTNDNDDPFSQVLRECDVFLSSTTLLEDKKKLSLLSKYSLPILEVWFSMEQLHVHRQYYSRTECFFSLLTS